MAAALAAAPEHRNLALAQRPAPRVLSPAVVRPRARRARTAVRPRDMQTNTHVERNLQKVDARSLLLSKTIDAAGPETQRFCGERCVRSSGSGVPAGAVAASGPSGHASSKARSRSLMPAQECARALVTQTCRESAVLEAAFERGQNCRGKIFRDEIVRCDSRADQNRGSGARRRSQQTLTLVRSATRARQSLDQSPTEMSQSSTPQTFVCPRERLLDPHNLVYLHSNDARPDCARRVPGIALSQRRAAGSVSQPA
jgi:hypothetical protein